MGMKLDKTKEPSEDFSSRALLFVPDANLLRQEKAGR